jgi:hypothetical protein
MTGGRSARWLPVLLVLVAVLVVQHTPALHRRATDQAEALGADLHALGQRLAPLGSHINEVEARVGEMEAPELLTETPVPTPTPPPGPSRLVDARPVPPGEEHAFELWMDDTDAPVDGVLTVCAQSTDPMAGDLAAAVQVGMGEADLGFSVDGPRCQTLAVRAASGIRFQSDGPAGWTVSVSVQR